VVLATTALAALSRAPSARAETPAVVAVLARPIGSWTPGGYAPAAPAGGPLLGVEGGGAVTLASSGDPALGGPAFGARAGWAFSDGLAVHLRYDYLGTRPGYFTGPLQNASAGLRYSFPFLVPLPFVEVNVGPAFGGGDARLTTGAGIGASFPLGAHLLVDAAARDWFVLVAGAIRQTLTGTLGLTVTFASPPR
jgi:hypothetical protein